MTKLIEALKELGVKSPEFGNLTINFRDGVPFDIIKEERIRIKK